VAPGIAAVVEEDVKPDVRKWVPFEGRFKEEFDRKWAVDVQVPEPEEQVQEKPIKEEPMEVIDNVYFLRDEYNA
jgi:hypothetical protein